MHALFLSLKVTFSDLIKHSLLDRGRNVVVESANVIQVFFYKFLLVSVN